MALAKTATFYVVTNKADGNSVVGYERGPDGAYQILGEYPAGGLGTGDLEIPALEKVETHPLANGDDPLISANAIVADDDRSHAVVVNPGDATIALMAIGEDRGLAALDTAQATDKFPVSVAVHGDIVVAASVGLDNMNGSIGAYRIDGDTLRPIAGSRRDLKARPSTIAFSADGRFVIVNELVTGDIKVFSIAGGELSEAPVSTITSPHDFEDRFWSSPSFVDTF